MESENMNSNNNVMDSSLDFMNLLKKHGDEIPQAVKNELVKIFDRMENELQKFNERTEEMLKEIAELQKKIDKLRRDFDYRSAE